MKYTACTAYFRWMLYTGAGVSLCKDSEIRTLSSPGERPDMEEIK